ncbi:helix-turn-helix domain-containing protein [Actinoplanes sp. TBRC 11911]|nr:helix-turn-helix domain-containing protein [Actinoplanes sp. TBRC 11911]
MAALSGVSVDYYARLEQGRVGVVSDQVLTAIEDALHLDSLERQHLRALVVPHRFPGRRQPPVTARPRAALQTLVASMDPIPALLLSRRLDVLLSNRAARILSADFDAMPVAERNIVRWLFLDPRTRVLFPQWEEVAAEAVAALRANRNPHVQDDELERLVGVLKTASADFARMWADYRLYQHGHGRKQFLHEAVGVITVNWETLPIPGADGAFISAYTPDVGSPSEERLRFLVTGTGAGSPA